jgi:hypothetical protein
MTHPDLVRAAFANPTPWQACILAIDPGAVSGWSVWVAGRLMAHGSASLPADRQMAVTRAFALSAGLPLIVVAETWNSQRFKGARKGRMERMGDAVLIGMGAERGRWFEQVDMMPPVRHGRWTGPKVVSVQPKVWRAPTVGNAGKSQVVNAAVLARAMAHAERAGLQRPDTYDAANAVIIGEWATRAAEVGAALPAAVRGAA